MPKRPGAPRRPGPSLPGLGAPATGRPPMARPAAPAGGPTPETVAAVQRDLDRALAARAAGDMNAAERGFIAVLERAPGQPDALNHLGMIRADQRRNEAAVELLAAAARRRPKDPAILNNYGHACLRARRFEEGIDALERAVALKPDFAEACGNLVQTLRAAGLAPRAEHYIDRLRTMKGGSLLADIEEARIRTDLGDKDRARALLEAAIAEHPDYGPAWQMLSQLRKWSEGDAFIDALLAEVERAPEPSVRLKALSYAAGKVFDDIGDYDRAFSFFARANEQEDIPYDHARTEEHFEAVASVFTRAFFERRTEHGVASRRPVFIVGMPRSGTTLTEQILATHESVFGAGELEYVARVRNDMALMVGGDVHFPNAAKSLSAPGAAALAFRYLDFLDRHDRTAERVTDKMPHNFIALGMLALIFPQATYIHCVRHPLDTCLSCWQRDFTATHAYNRKLEWLGAYYSAYRRLMKRYEEALPVGVFTADYDRMVADQEGATRDLAAHAGLSWSDDLLNFHETDRRVATPSNWQVRQPLYQGSSARWKKYEKHLGPLIDALDPHLL